MGIPEASPAADAAASPIPPEVRAVPIAVQLVTAGANMINKRASDRDVEQERSMADIVKTFNAYSGHNLTEIDGWAFMVILKLIRSKRGNFKADDFIDMASYAGLMGEARFEADESPNTTGMPS